MWKPPACCVTAPASQVMCLHQPTIVTPCHKTLHATLEWLHWSVLGTLLFIMCWCLNCRLRIVLCCRPSVAPCLNVLSESVLIFAFSWHLSSNNYHMLRVPLVCSTSGRSAAEQALYADRSKGHIIQHVGQKLALVCNISEWWPSLLHVVAV